MQYLSQKKTNKDAAGEMKARAGEGRNPQKGPFPIFDGFGIQACPHFLAWQ